MGRTPVVLCLGLVFRLVFRACLVEGERKKYFFIVRILLLYVPLAAKNITWWNCYGLKSPVPGRPLPLRVLLLESQQNVRGSSVSLSVSLSLKPRLSRSLAFTSFPPALLLEFTATGPSLSLPRLSRSLAFWVFPAWFASEVCGSSLSLCLSVSQPRLFAWISLADIAVHPGVRHHRPRVRAGAAARPGGEPRVRGGAARRRPPPGGDGGC